MLFGGLALVCIATMLTLLLGLAYGWTHGYLDKEKLNRVVEVVRGEDVPHGAETADKPKAPPQAEEQPSYDDIERSRGVKTRDLELREQSVESGIERIRFETRKLTDERDRYDLLKTSFEKVLKDRRNDAILAGRENIRLIWENIKPKQAKEQILQMIEQGQQNEVVAILSSISITKRAKIISEFKTEDESKKLEEILRLIREGIPDVLPIDQTREELKKFNPKQPQPTQAN
jgi:flagellar motility protein MotE (MotC chaperone)